jgi:hypothetical protein
VGEIDAINVRTASARHAVASAIPFAYDYLKRCDFSGGDHDCVQSPGTAVPGLSDSDIVRAGSSKIN